MTRILVPPGVGDIYWVLVKLKSFLKANGLTDPELTIVSYPDEQKNHLRSIEFLEMFPWIKIGNPQSVPNDPALQDIWNEAYNGPGRSIFPGVMGYDYFMAYNGRINSGGWLEDDNFECEWLPQVNLPLPFELQRTSMPFVLCFFPFFGTYVSHERDFPIPKIAEIINGLGVTPVFVGGRAEREYNTRLAELIALVPGSLDLVGCTSIVGIVGLMQGCRGIFGYHSGLPNLGAAIGTPTVLLWDDRYPQSTSYACVPPWVRDTTYKAVPTKDLTVEKLKEIIWKTI